MSRRTLEEAPQKVLNLLRGFGTCLPAREALNNAGYSKEAHEEGWALLHAASGYEPGKQSLFSTDVVVRDAIVECDRWDEQGLRRILAALNRHHPDQAAIATLASRGITQPERARLAELVKVATSAKMPELAETSADTAAARDQSLRALHALVHRVVGDGAGGRDSPRLSDPPRPLQAPQEERLLGAHRGSDAVGHRLAPRSAAGELAVIRRAPSSLTARGFRLRAMGAGLGSGSGSLAAVPGAWQRSLELGSRSGSLADRRGALQTAWEASRSTAKAWQTARVPWNRGLRAPRARLGRSFLDEKAIAAEIMRRFAGSPSSLAVREASGVVREASGVVREAPRVVREAPRVAREASGVVRGVPRVAGESFGVVREAFEVLREAVRARAKRWARRGQEPPRPRQPPHVVREATGFDDRGTPTS